MHWETFSIDHGKVFAKISMDSSSECGNKLILKFYVNYVRIFRISWFFKWAFNWNEIIEGEESDNNEEDYYFMGNLEEEQRDFGM